jgi:nesprin-1
MRENLVLHWQEIMRVRHLLHILPTSLRMSVSPVDVEKEISQLEDDYVDIEKRLGEVEGLLKNRFNLWKRFERQLETIQQSIQETDFMVELLTVHGNIDYDRLLKATEKLEVRKRCKSFYNFLLKLFSLRDFTINLVLTKMLCKI